MKSHHVLLLILLLPLLAACQGELSSAPPAEVSDATTVAPTGTQPAPGATTADVIKEKSSIAWVGAKVTRQHEGGFRNFDGRIEYTGGQPSRIAFEIDMNSVYSDNERLTGHLKSPDFFDVARFPRATFVSTSIGPAEPGAPAGTTHTVRGILDLHGVKKEITIPVVAQQSPDGVRTTSEFMINRHDWGISYRGAADDLIRDNVVIKLDLHFPAPPA